MISRAWETFPEAGNDIPEAGSYFPGSGTISRLRNDIGRRASLPFPPPQARRAGLGDAEVVEHAERVVIEEAAQVLTADVEGGHRRQQGVAGVEQPAHVLDVDEGEGGLAEAQDERPALLERHRPGAVDESAGGARRQRSEGAGAAGEDSRAAQPVGARGDRRVELAVAMD